MYNTGPFEVNLTSNARNKTKKDIKNNNTKDNIKSNNRFMGLNFPCHKKAQKTQKKLTTNTHAPVKQLVGQEGAPDK